MRRILIGIFLMASALVHAQASVTIREISKNSFVANLVSDTELRIEDAQLRVLEAATRACKDRTPKLEHYDFESSKLISSTTSPVPDRFEFNQQFSCQVRTAMASDPTSPTVISEVEKEQLVKTVTSETRRVISSASNDSFQEFHAKFSPALGTMFPLSEWVKQQVRLHETAGALKDDPLLKVTTYVDPPNSPGPGIYMAVDFQASYDNAPFRCGFVIWLLGPQSNLMVLRVEDGILYSKDAASMTTDAIEQIKQQFRCVAP